MPGKDPELPPIDTTATRNGGFFCCEFREDAGHHLLHPAETVPVSRETEEFPGPNDELRTATTSHRSARFT